MTIHVFNGFTCNARVPSHWHTGALCLLIETNQGLVLVDTGLGQEDYVRKSGILRIFQAVTIVPLDPEEAAVRQIVRLGYQPEDVRHIVLTHMHFDHCGGLPDFPQALVYVHRREYEAFVGRPRRWTDLAYVRRHIAHQPKFVLMDAGRDERWFGFPAIRVLASDSTLSEASTPFDPAMWLVPLFGHTRGHCGVAIQTEFGWLFHVGDAAPIESLGEVPSWLVHFVLGPHMPRLRKFAAGHPEVRMTTGHMALDFFREVKTL